MWPLQGFNYRRTTGGIWSASQIIARVGRQACDAVRGVVGHPTKRSRTSSKTPQKRSRTSNRRSRTSHGAGGGSLATAAADDAHRDVGFAGPQLEARLCRFHLGLCVEFEDLLEAAHKLLPKNAHGEILGDPKLHLQPWPGDCGRLMQVAHPIRKPLINIDAERRPRFGG